MAVLAEALESFMKIQFIDTAHKWYTMYSIWFFAALGVMPEVYNLALQFNILEGDAAPAQLSRLINLVAFFGALSRLVKQKKLSMEQEAIIVQKIERESQMGNSPVGGSN